MLTSPEWPEVCGEKAGSVRRRYAPRALTGTRPSGESAAIKFTALTTDFGRNFGFGIAAALADWAKALATSGASGGVHSKNWSLALRSASGVFASPTMWTVALRSRSLRQR